MCNNIRANILKKEVKKEVVKDKISDWLESRPIIPKNTTAISLKEVDKDLINYVSGHPLKLHDGTRIHSISSETIDETYKAVTIVYCFHKANKKNTTTIKRYIDDSLTDVEEFLANSQSIFQLRNIDLNYK